MDAVSEGTPRPADFKVVPLGADYIRSFLQNPDKYVGSRIVFKVLDFPHHESDPFLRISPLLLKVHGDLGQLVTAINPRQKEHATPELAPFKVSRFTDLLASVAEGQKYTVAADKKGRIVINARGKDRVDHFTLDQHPVRTLLRCDNFTSDAHLEEAYQSYAEILQAAIQTFMESAGRQPPSGMVELIPRELDKAHPDEVIDLRDPQQ